MPRTGQERSHRPRSNPHTVTHLHALLQTLRGLLGREAHNHAWVHRPITLLHLYSLLALLPYLKAGDSASCRRESMMCIRENDVH